MKFKEKTEETGKEGCARVMGYYQGLLAHSYTMELTYHSILDQTTKEEIKPLELSDLEDLGRSFCQALIFQFGLNRCVKVKNALKEGIKMPKMDLNL